MRGRPGNHGLVRGQPPAWPSSGASSVERPHAALRRTSSRCNQPTLLRPFVVLSGVAIAITWRPCGACSLRRSRAYEPPRCQPIPIEGATAQRLAMRPQGGHCRRGRAQTGEDPHRVPIACRSFAGAAQPVRHELDHRAPRLGAEEGDRGSLNGPQCGGGGHDVTVCLGEIVGDSPGPPSAAEPATSRRTAPPAGTGEGPACTGPSARSGAAPRRRGTLGP